MPTVNCAKSFGLHNFYYYFFFDNDNLTWTYYIIDRAYTPNNSFFLNIPEMAQVLAVPGDVRHGFSYNRSFNHDFGRITGIAATAKGNILLCDHNNKNLILVDALGNYLTKLSVDSEPYDVAITCQNIGYITQPYSRSVLKIDPDRLVVFFKSTCKDLSTSVVCVSAVPNTYNDNRNAITCWIGVNRNGVMSRQGISSDNL
ncbi:unnamed protein product [Mytilus edulis]|uniref:Uncharacterized protein n=1 Tax=Mytilus edulis TaxID=6550 RepID=A0A8S3TKT3_MYTED|nr:unnamed protein product [Mytilus edulis]